MKTHKLLYPTVALITLFATMLSQGAINYTGIRDAYADITLAEDTFGDDGKVITPIGSGDDWGQALAIQPDGKVVVVGNTNTTTDVDYAVVRYDPDGSLDTLFGNAGIVVTDFGYNDRAYAVTLQADGKIVVAGSSKTAPCCYGVWAIARYNSDGSLDTSFGSGGKVTTDFSGFNDHAHSVAIQPDGKIVVTGMDDNGWGTDFAVVRYNADGSLDTTFSGDGKVVTAIDVRYDEALADVLLQSDGKIVLAGCVQTGPPPGEPVLAKEFGLARYNSDGSLDTSFGNNGLVVTNLGTQIECAYASALQSDGKIVLAGYAGGSDSLDVALARYNGDGTFDTTFGDNGKVIFDLGSVGDYISGLALQTDGKIVASGYSGGDFALLRYHTDGNLDTTFGGSGYVTTDFAGGVDWGWDVAIQTDGKIVVAGYANNGTDYDFALARYNPDGSLGTNTDPVLTADQELLVMDEGQMATNTGTVRDAENDPVTLGASVGTVTNNGDGTWSWSFGTSDGPSENQTVTITADDGKGGIGEVSFDLTVNNVAPTIDAITGPVDPVDINDQSSAIVTVTFSDPGADTHDVTWEWGDDSSDTQTNSTSPAFADHTYAEPGVYTIQVTVTDDDGGSDTEFYEFIVIYDPDGGFVTGGGWIDSPLGAYAPDPSLTGKANFGFVSKYKKGASIPTGNTEFQFKAGNLNFHSNTYQWLVVNQGGANAQFKGSGTINGDGDYPFMLWAGDGETDTFRIKIWWEEDDTEHVIYDSGTDQPIGGGSIVVHTGKK